MTYKEVVNSVLTRLREKKVASVDQNEYSALIGELVKDAIQMCEDSWDWSHLRTTVAATTEVDAISYTLTDCKHNTEILNVVCEEGNNFLTYKPSAWFTNAYLNRGLTSGYPIYYCTNGVDDETGDMVIDIYPRPDGVYSVYFNVVKRTSVSDITDDTKIKIPTMPVVMLAYAFAIRERGEQAGDSVNEQLSIARSALSDAIAIDASRTPEDLQWYNV